MSKRFKMAAISIMGCEASVLCGVCAKSLTQVFAMALIIAALATAARELVVRNDNRGVNIGD